MKSKTFKFMLPVLLPAVILTFASCSSTSELPGEETSVTAYQAGVPGGVRVNTLEVRATVAAVDAANRKVTLTGTDGKKVTVKVEPDAINFDQLAVGDQVLALVTEELVVSLQEAGATSTEGVVGAVVLAPQGVKPGGVIAETTQVTARVTAINVKKRTATLQFEDGSHQTFPVRSDVDLSQRKVGEQVVFRATELIAIRVEKP